MPGLAQTSAMALLFGAVGLAFVVGPSVIDGRIPGDIGDARFNSYVLEHFFRWITGQAPSFWNADFFYPFPLTIAFSDNHLGNAFIYAAFRAIGLVREDAFRAWYVVGFVVNFAAAVYALVRLGYAELPAAAGAFLFTFGMPVMVQAGHAQLLYRFGVPLAVLALEEFRSHGQLRHLALAAFWTTWQFYCSIYDGYFLSLLLLALLIGHALCHRGSPIVGLRSLASAARKQWTDPPARTKAAFLLTMTVLAALMVLLCAPYVEVDRLYGFRRYWFETAQMLPRPVSYLLASGSRLWPSKGALFDALPMRHEHAMFIGAAPLLAIAVATTLRLANRATLDRLFAPAAFAVLLLVLLTLWVDGHSAYRVLARLPGANAIRSVTRVIVILMFPFGLLLAASLNAILGARLPGCFRTGAVAALIALLFAESSFITHITATKQQWQARMAAVAAKLPPNLPSAPILLLAPQPGQSVQWPREIDAMLFAQDRGWRTLNGYSGNAPPRHQILGECQDAAILLSTGLAFLGRDTDQDYRALTSHVVKAGYPQCDDAVLSPRPQVTMFAGPIPAPLMASVALSIEGLEVRDGQIVILATIVNKSPSLTLPAYSTTVMPIRFSARFVDARATPPDLQRGPGWDLRQDIAFDVPPGTSQPVIIPIAPPAEPGIYRVAASMVQDRVAWFHDHGMHIPISMQIVEVDKDHGVRVIRE